MRYVPDPYRALGVARGATDAEIKAAHRRLAKRYHPDASGGDTERFLLVQEAYALLSDPLRRREWDARHNAGPVRASERGSARPRGPDGRWTRADPPSGGAPGSGPAERRAPPGRDPASRSYTWSASEVPWWEEGGARDGRRRQPGRKRPRQSQAGAEDQAGPGRRAQAEPAPQGPQMSQTQDFDVYNRSSGAAWSMAARAFFRKGDFELPRRGAFRYQGNQPLTAARARVAAEEEARRAQAPASSRGFVDDRPAARAAGTTPDRPVSRSATMGDRVAARTAAGIVRDAQGINEVRAAAREQALAARWPSLGQRLLYALLAWLPIALVVGYGGTVATGCDRAAVGCPPELGLIQGLIIGLTLAVLFVLPRLAYAMTYAAAGVALTAMALVVVVWVTGLRTPLPPAALAVSTVLLLVVHLVVASWVLSGAVRRPWAAARSPRLGRRGDR